MQKEGLPLKERLRSAAKQRGPAVLTAAVVLALWQAVSASGLVPGYMLPAPAAVGRVFLRDWPELWGHAAITLREALYGLALGTAIGFLLAVAMDAFDVLFRAVYPILVILQTVPAVAIAPLLVLWFGYEMTPKIILVVVSSCFPVTVGVLDGYRAVDRDSIDLLRSMGAGRWQVFRYIKCPSAVPQFFSGLRIAAAYAVVGAVIAEWLGGFGGLGVYMTRVKKAFAFDKMFAVLFLISAISLALMGAVNLAERLSTPYRQMDRNT